jgi:hypothetical protein
LLKTILTIKGAPEITALFENFGLSIIPEEAQVLMKLIARGKENTGFGTAESKQNTTKQPPNSDITALLHARQGIPTFFREKREDGVSLSSISIALGAPRYLIFFRE